MSLARTSVLRMAARRPARSSSLTGCHEGRSIIVAGMEPAEVAAFVAEVQDAVPGGTRQEFLLLDDHTSPWRRDIVGALEGVGDAMRLVPKPSGGRGTEFDALSLSARSEFLVASFGEAAPVGSLGAALAQMWSRGADAVVIDRRILAAHADGSDLRRHGRSAGAGLGDRIAGRQPGLAGVLLTDVTVGVSGQ